MQTINHRPFFSPFGSQASPPTIIAGPCSAETESQLFETASALAKNKRVTVFRCGIWKPRTRPNGFEGVGVVALQWLRDIKKEFSLKTCVEVASPKHVEECLKHEVDILWIGSRTTSNPFSVQALADALRGTNVPVLIKNPLNPDINLWIGALERIQSAGIQQIAAIHRGFSLTGKSNYRNSPCWEIPIELRRQFPDLTQICDPSHMGGQPKHILPLSQYAMDLGMDGLMIEVHSRPTYALTDAFQQITPEQLHQILYQLTIHQQIAHFPDKVEALRVEIDHIDHHLLETLARRMSLAQEIGSWKKKQNFNIYQPERWQQMLAERLQQAEKLGLEADFVQTIMEFIHERSIKMQNKIYH